MSSDPTTTAASSSPNNGAELAWYFAYGSNMSEEQCVIRIGRAVERKLMCLPNYYLIPNKPSDDPTSTFGYMNIERSSGYTTSGYGGTESPCAVRHACEPVFGVAYHITLEQLHKMDGFESGYKRIPVDCYVCDARIATSTIAPSKASLEAQLESAETVECWAYQALDGRDDLKPSREYVGRVLEGRDCLPPWYVEEIEAMETNELRSPRQDLRLQKLL